MTNASSDREVTFRLAGKNDSPVILQFFHSLSMPSDIEIVYKREPDFFHACEVQGTAQVLIAEKQEGGICGIAVRTLKHAYINGEKQVLGYLSDMRIVRPEKHLRILTEGYAQMKKLHQDGQALLHIATIIEGNRKAKSALTWSNKAHSIPN